MISILNGFANHELKVSKDVYNPSDVRTLLEDLTCLWNGHIYVIKAGFVTDGASIPRAMWRIVGHPWGHYMPAAVLHDAFYASHLVSREEADEALRDLMLAIGVPKWKAIAMYQAVKMFGGFAWNNKEQLANVVNEFDYLESLDLAMKDSE